MSKSIKPLVVCDGDCARANGCRVGGYQCSECGGWYCPHTDGGAFFDGLNYTCSSCADEIYETED